MARFSKATLISQLKELNESQYRDGGFDCENGTAQLHPRGANSPVTDELINRAVDYGRWQQIQDLIWHLEEGNLGK